VLINLKYLIKKEKRNIFIDTYGNEYILKKAKKLKSSALIYEENFNNNLDYLWHNYNIINEELIDNNIFIKNEFKKYLKKLKLSGQ